MPLRHCRRLRFSVRASSAAVELVAFVVEPTSDLIERFVIDRQRPVGRIKLGPKLVDRNVEVIEVEDAVLGEFRKLNEP